MIFLASLAFSLGGPPSALRRGRAGAGGRDAWAALRGSRDSMGCFGTCTAPVQPAASPPPRLQRSKPPGGFRRLGVFFRGDLARWPAPTSGSGREAASLAASEPTAAEVQSARRVPCLCSGPPKPSTCSRRPVEVSPTRYGQDRRRCGFVRRRQTRSGMSGPNSAMRSPLLHHPPHRRKRRVLASLERHPAAKADQVIAAAVLAAPCPHLVGFGGRDRDGDVGPVFVALPLHGRRGRHGVASPPPAFFGRPRPR